MELSESRQRSGCCQLGLLEGLLSGQQTGAIEVANVMKFQCARSRRRERRRPYANTSRNRETPMKRSSDKTHAGLAASPQFRSCWLRTILAGTALVLATTAQGPTASAGAVYGFTQVVCAPEDKVCELGREAEHQNFVEGCREAGGTSEGNTCVI